MEVIFFYCEEEELAFTRMQVVAGQCQALAAALAGLVGLILYVASFKGCVAKPAPKDVDPTTPFWVSGSLVLLAFVLYTVFFLVKVGCQHITLQAEAGVSRFLDMSVRRKPDRRTRGMTGSCALRILP